MLSKRRRPRNAAAAAAADGCAPVKYSKQAEVEGERNILALGAACLQD